MFKLYSGKNISDTPYTSSTLHPVLIGITISGAFLAFLYIVQVYRFLAFLYIVQVYRYIHSIPLHSSGIQIPSFHLFQKLKIPQSSLD